LSITADSATEAEDVSVRDGSNPGSIDVVPGTGITVNGHAGTVTINGVYSVKVSLKGGDDYIFADRLNLPGSLTLEGDDGRQLFLRREMPYRNESEHYQWQQFGGQNQK